MKDYLFYVKYSLSGLYVYHCKTDDPFHVMGEMMYMCPEDIDRLSFVKQAESNLEFWKENNFKIHEWENQYESKSD